MDKFDFKDSSDVDKADNINEESNSINSVNVNSDEQDFSVDNTDNESNVGSQYGRQEGYTPNSASEDPDVLRSASFYTENHKKSGGRKNIGAFQLIALSLVSSIFGGIVVWAFLVFVTPSVQPTVDSFFSKTNSSQDTAAVVKKVEIEKTDSPVTAIAEKVGPSIVGIRATYKTVDFIFQQQQEGEGSGIIIRKDGYIMTNFHVVGDAVDSNTKKLQDGAKIEVFLPSQKDKPHTAQVVGYDVRTDLAILKIDATNLPVAELGDSDKVKVGELAVAIGNPAGLEYMGSITAGLISGLNRTVATEAGKEIKLIQTDAAINPGNSGGALVNSQGQVIGINSVKVVAQGFEGLGFAIPINKAKEICDSLMQYKYVKGRPILGVSPDSRFNEEMAKQYNVPIGVLVADVTPLSGAYKAGIRAGDIITKFEGKAVKDRTELDDLRNKHSVGDTVAVEIYRDGKTFTLKVTLSEDKG